MIRSSSKTEQVCNTCRRSPLSSHSLSGFVCIDEICLIPPRNSIIHAWHSCFLVEHEPMNGDQHTIHPCMTWDLSNSTRPLMPKQTCLVSVVFNIDYIVFP